MSFYWAQGTFTTSYNFTKCITCFIYLLEERITYGKSDTLFHVGWNWSFEKLKFMRAVFFLLCSIWSMACTSYNYPQYVTFYDSINFHSFAMSTSYGAGATNMSKHDMWLHIINTNNQYICRDICKLLIALITHAPSWFTSVHLLPKNMEPN